MSVKILLCFLLISTAMFSQEIGSVKNGKHSIRLLKSDVNYSLVYSDINSKAHIIENTICFSIKESIYKIIMDGFNEVEDHQIIVQTANDTIVKFEFKKIRGEKLLKIKQNNLADNTFGASTFFSKLEIQKLFGNSYM